MSGAKRQRRTAAVSSLETIHAVAHDRGEKEEAEADTPSAPTFHDFSGMELVSNHAHKPIWVCPNHYIFLETFSPIYKQAYDFLIAVAEPVCRPEHVHEYKLTTHSLYAAASVGLDTSTIVRGLERLSKTKVTDELRSFVEESTASYGKVKLVLKNNTYTVESRSLEILQSLLTNKTFKEARMQAKAGEDSNTATIIQTKSHAVKEDTFLDLDDEEDEDEGGGENGGEGALAHDLFSFQIRSDRAEAVKKAAIDDVNPPHPLLEEYDFRNDTVNPNLKMDLKPTTTIRPYQEKSLSKMFSNGRARSGIIVLPCGAGKTLVGITAACTVKKSVLVLCTSAVAVEQWRSQFKMWTTLDENLVSRFTSDCKESGWLVPKKTAGILVTTYTMISYSGKRAEDSAKVWNKVKNHEWGLILLDEVHVVPANVFRQVVFGVHAHCKLGLTATLVREDDKIKDLHYLIGPKLYEANWLDLQRENYIATVSCAEVWCPMTAEFYHRYLRDKSARRRLLYAMNPNKFLCCKFLIEYHENRGDKVIVFSDIVVALMWYARRLGKPYIYGPTSQAERMHILNQFQNNPSWNCIFISKVGDNSIDLPGANVIIQISSHFGARRQEAQRLGRILRAKPRKGSKFNAFFYTLVSKDTQEMYYSSKRQQFLVDQGYSFQVITELDDLQFRDNDEDSTDKLGRDALEVVLKAHDSDVAEEEIEVKDSVFNNRSTGITINRRIGNIAEMSGGAGKSYVEYDRK